MDYPAVAKLQSSYCGNPLASTKERHLPEDGAALERCHPLHRWCQDLHHSAVQEVALLPKVASLHYLGASRVELDLKVRDHVLEEQAVPACKQPSTAEAVM